MEILVNFTAVLFIGLIVWWFWIAKPKSRKESGAQPIDIVVSDGVYTPARIEVPAGRPIVLRFLRKDPSPCAEKVLFDDLGVSTDLAVGKKTDVIVVPPSAGEYEFTCQMKMYRGVLVARS
jgi:plastocyanin domain-containing protein